MTGFRLAFGGAQELFGDTPDLTVLGKIVGGGLPVGAYGGRADIMKKIMPAGPVFQAGTLSGNPAGDGRRHRHAAGTAREPAVRPARAAERSDRGRAAGGGNGGRDSAPVRPRRQHVDAVLHRRRRSSIYDSAKTSDTARFGRFFWAMMDRGVYLPCSQFEAAFTSAAHTMTRMSNRR